MKLIIFSSFFLVCLFSCSKKEQGSELSTELTPEQIKNDNNSKQVLYDLRVLSKSVEVGISYNQYSRKLSDDLPRIAVAIEDLPINSFSSLARKILRDHKFALLVWEHVINKADEPVSIEDSLLIMNNYNVTISLIDVWGEQENVIKQIWNASDDRLKKMSSQINQNETVFRVDTKTAFPTIIENKTEKPIAKPIIKTLEEITLNELRVRGGIYYRVNQSTPFTGAVKGKQTRKGKSESVTLSANFKKGKLHGLFESFYDNGQRYEQVFYVNGFREGEAKKWFVNGALRGSMNFKKGKLNRLFKTSFKLNKSNGKEEPEVIFMCDGDVQDMVPVYISDNHDTSSNAYKVILSWACVHGFHIHALELSLVDGDSPLLNQIFWQE